MCWKPLNWKRVPPYIGRTPGRPLEDRTAIARAFVTKMVYNMATTRILLDRLESDPTVRRLCGWECKEDAPSESTFSRAYAEFAESHLPERVHQALIEQHHGEQLIGHISRDSTAITAHEKPEKRAAPVETKPKKCERPGKGEERPKVLTRLERQPLSKMLADLPKTCNVGTKRNSKGHTTSWIGYKPHIDTADGGIPVSCLLTSTSLYDSQVVIPLAESTNQQVTSLYDMMDSAYDAPHIKAHSRALGYVPLIDPNPRSKIKKAEMEPEAKRRR